MTTTTAPPTAWAALEAALGQRRPVWVSYHGRWRVLCPHALGWKNGRAMLLGYQSGGQTSTGVLSDDPAKRWRCLFVEEIERVEQAEPTSAWQSAPNYNPARPFSSVDRVAIAIASDRPVTPPVR